MEPVIHPCCVCLKSVDLVMAVIEDKHWEFKKKYIYPDCKKWVLVDNVRCHTK